MPQTKSAKKALRQTKTRTTRNLLVKKNLNYLLRNFKKSLESGDKTKAQELSKKLIKSLDKAAQKNVIHKNSAARKKSRMMNKINKKKYEIIKYSNKKVMTYIMVKKTKLVPPSNKYLNSIKQGYKDCKLEKKCLLKALMPSW